MNIKSLGTALVATAALCGAEAGCQSAEEDAAIHAVVIALKDITAITTESKDSLLAATEGEYSPNMGPALRFTTDEKQQGDVSTRSEVFCSRGTTRFHTILGDAFQNSDGGAACTHRVYELSNTGADEGQPVSGRLKSWKKDSIGLGSGRYNGGRTEVATVVRGMERTEVIFFDGGEGKSACKVRDKVQETKVPAKFCLPVFPAARDALDKIFKAGEGAGKAVEGRFLIFN